MITCLPNLVKCIILQVGLTTVRTANRAVWFAHKPNRAQPPRFGSPYEPHRNATVQFVWGVNHHGSLRFAAVRHGSPNLRSPPLFFMVRDIFSRGFHTHTNISSQFSISIYIRAMCFRRQSHCGHPVCIPDPIFPSFAPFQNSPMPTLPRILACDRIIPSFTDTPHSADAVLHFSHSHSIHVGVRTLGTSLHITRDGYPTLGI